jgi:hypothetical protein
MGFNHGPGAASKVNAGAFLKKRDEGVDYFFGSQIIVVSLAFLSSMLFEGLGSVYL